MGKTFRREKTVNHQRSRLNKNKKSKSGRTVYDPLADDEENYAESVQPESESLVERKPQSSDKNDN